MNEKNSIEEIIEIKTTQLIVRLMGEFFNFVDNLSDQNEIMNPKEKIFENFYYWLKNIQPSN